MRQRTDVLTTDAIAHTRFPDALEQVAAAFLPTDEAGLIGRNRAWGGLYSPRFQLGAGYALRVAIAAQRPTEGIRAFRAIEAATEVIEPDGYVPSTIPAEVSNGREPSPADIASGAAFFLGDACMGLMALDQTAQPDDIVPAERSAAVREDLTRAIDWLLTQQDVLLQADQSAPNRLLFNARSFQACGAFASDEALRVAAEQAAQRFVTEALSLYADAGYFIEGGGYDTSYQGVALRVGEDILLSGYADSNGQLQTTVTSAADWLAARVDSEGQIDSSGNARTCEGGEVFLGVKKQVSVVDVFVGLAYASVRTEQNTLEEAAQRIVQWTRENRDGDPCFP